MTLAEALTEIDRLKLVNEHDRRVYSNRLVRVTNRANIAGGVVRKIAPVWGQLSRWHAEMRRRVEGGYHPTRAEQDLFDAYEEAKDVDLQSP